MLGVVGGIAIQWLVLHRLLPADTGWSYPLRVPWVWATLCGQEIPERLPRRAERILRDLRWRRAAGRNPPEHWFTTLRDAPRPGPIDAETRAGTAALAGRLAAWV